MLIGQVQLMIEGQHPGIVQKSRGIQVHGIARSRQW